MTFYSINQDCCESDYLVLRHLLYLIEASRTLSLKNLVVLHTLHHCSFPATVWASIVNNHAILVECSLLLRSPRLPSQSVLVQYGYASTFLARHRVTSHETEETTLDLAAVRHWTRDVCAFFLNHGAKHHWYHFFVSTPDASSLSSCWATIDISKLLDEG